MELVFNVIAINGNIGYASDFERNGLFEVNIETGESKYIGLFPGEESMTSSLHCYGEWIENKVYFIPAAGKNISIYHIDSKEIETIEIPKVSKIQNANYTPKLKFVKSLQYNGFLWLIPATYPGILKFDLSTNKMDTINNWISNNEYMFRRAVCTRTNTIYAASGNNNNVLIFNMDSENGKIVKIGKSNNGIMDMCESGDDLVMAPRKDGAVIRWNPTLNEVEEYKDYPAEFNPGQIVFQYIYEYNSEFVLMPAHANHGIRLSGNKMKIDTEIQWKTDTARKVEFMFETEYRIYFRAVLSDLSSRFYFISKKNNTLSNFHFTVSNPEERQKIIAKSAMENQEVIRESASFGLHDWLKSII